MPIKQTEYEFVVRAKHPVPEMAERQIEIMRTLVGHVASMLHDAQFNNGTATISPTRKLHQHHKKKVVKAKESSPYTFPSKDVEEMQTEKPSKSSEWVKDA